MASMSGMPAFRSTLRVRQIRAITALRIRGPKSGTRSFMPSMIRRPCSVWMTT